MLTPKIVKGWFGGSAAKTSTVYFGYSLLNTYGSFEENEELYHKYMEQFDRVTNTLFRLHQEGQVQLVYVDNYLVERRIVAFRFTSSDAYNLYRDELVSMANLLGRGVWEPYRNDHQYAEWFGHLPLATPTVSLR